MKKHNIAVSFLICALLICRNWQGISIYAQSKSSFSERGEIIEFREFGWRDCRIIGLKLQQGGVNLIGERKEACSDLTRTKPLELTLITQINDHIDSPKIVNIILYGKWGYFIRRIPLFSGNNGWKNSDIGRMHSQREILMLPSHLPAAEYKVRIELNRGESHEIANISLPPCEIYDLDNKPQKGFDIPHTELAYGGSSELNISDKIIMNNRLMLAWSGSECAGYIKNEKSRDIVFSIVAQKAGGGEEIPQFGFYINGKLTEKHSVESRELKNYRIPLRLTGGENDFSIRYLNGGNNKVILIDKVVIK